MRHRASAGGLRRAGTATALAIGVALWTGGCGSSDGPAAVVRQAVETKGVARCDLYTDSFFERQAGTSAAAGRRYCRQVAGTLPTSHVAIVKTDVTGNAATVVARARGTTVTYQLVRRAGRWLIDALTG